MKGKNSGFHGSVYLVSSMIRGKSAAVDLEKQDLHAILIESRKSMVLSIIKPCELGYAFLG